MKDNIDKIIQCYQKDRILCLDVGDKTIGISVSDMTWLIANPVTVIKRTSIKRDIDELKKIVDYYKPCLIIYGWPLETNGRTGKQCEKVSIFIEAIKDLFSILLVKWDERFSTKIANSVLIEADLSRSKRSKIIDKMASTYILQGALDFLNSQRNLKNTISDV